jgi:hypothetical protein
LKWPEGIFPERDNSWLNCSDIWKQRENTMNWWIKLLISLTKHHYNPLKSNLYPRLYTKAWNNLICSWLQCEFHIYFPIDPIYIQSQQTLPSGQFIRTKKKKRPFHFNTAVQINKLPQIGLSKWIWSYHLTRRRRSKERKS